MRMLIMGWLIALLLAWKAAPSWEEPGPESYGDELALSGLRYKKGLELIRTLYEKLLALDHHFSSLRTGQWVQSLGSPASYAALKSLSPPVGGDLHHPQLWATLLLDQWQSGALTPSAKEKEQLLCLLEFCVEMHADLRLIVYETAFLTRTNTQLQRSCEDLFGEYVQIIGYSQSLETCRKTDDWESVLIALDRHLDAMRRRRASGDPADAQRLLRDHINLEFAVDRLLNFLDDYQFHIQEGVQYYQKFQWILNNLEPGPACSDMLPASWTQLHGEIRQSLRSFDQAYQVPEFRGSKLKDLLYGFSD